MVAREEERDEPRKCRVGVGLIVAAGPQLLRDAHRPWPEDVKIPAGQHFAPQCDKLVSDFGYHSTSRARSFYLGKDDARARGAQWTAPVVDVRDLPVVSLIEMVGINNQDFLHLLASHQNLDQPPIAFIAVKDIIRNYKKFITGKLS